MNAIAGARANPRRRAPGRLRRTLALTGLQLRLLLRNAENLLVTLVIPVAVLVFFATVDVLDLPADRVGFLTPGVIALAVVASGLVALGIQTGFERGALVVKRLGATPLRRGDLVAAKLLSTAAVVLVQVAVICGVALALGWAPELGGVLWAVAGLVLGIAAFAGLGLLLAGTLPPLLTLALTNGLFVLLLLASGLVVPLDALPGWAASVARALPAAPLADWLRAGLDGARLPALSAAVLPLWAVLAPLAAARLFRWE